MKLAVVYISVILTGTFVIVSTVDIRYWKRFFENSCNYFVKVITVWIK